MTIVYFLGAALFFLICQGLVSFCETLKESGS
jgi:hypothetical protein